MERYVVWKISWTLVKSRNNEWSPSEVRELAVNHFRQNLTVSFCLQLLCVPWTKRKSYLSVLFNIHDYAMYQWKSLNVQFHTLPLSILVCKLRALVLCLLLRPESGEGVSFCQAIPLRDTISARPERLDLHWSVRGVSAPADGPRHSTRLPAQHSHGGQTGHQPEKLRYLHCEENWEVRFCKWMVHPTDIR